MTTTLFIQILNMSLGAAWAALLVMIARFFLRRFSHCYSYALWGVVLFRLVCPVSFSSVLSLMPRPQPIPQEIVYAARPEIESGFAVIDQAVSSALSSAPAAPPPVTAPTVPAAANPVQFWLGVGKLIWLAGMVLLLLYGLASYLHLLGKLRGAVLVKDNVWESDRIPTAFVLGFIRPRIYLPTGLKETERNYVLCHEQTHIRRLDHILKPVSLLLLTVHWFNPILWLAWFLMRRDMEMSCDELALRKLGEENRKGYSACLLNLSARQSGLVAPLAFGENDVKGRIVNILRYKKPALWGTALAVVLAAALGFCLLANPGDDRGIARPDISDDGGSGITLADDGGSASQSEAPSQGDDLPGGSAATPEDEAHGLITYTPPVRRDAVWQSDEAVWNESSYFGSATLRYYVAKGTPIYSPIAGIVDEIVSEPLWPYGKRVAVQSTENPDIKVLLVHLDSPAEGLQVGDAVSINTLAGYAGSTGNATYPGVGVVFQHKVYEGDYAGEYRGGVLELWDRYLENWPDCLYGYLDTSAQEPDTAGEKKDAAPAAPLVGYTRPVRMDDVKRAALTEAELDLLVEWGTPVYSPICGTVEELQSYSVWPYGKSVVVSSSENPDIKVMVAHLASVEGGIAVGDKVDAATQLGLSGITGNTPYHAVGVVVLQKTDDVFSEIEISQWAEVLVNSLFEEESS